MADPKVAGSHAMSPGGLKRFEGVRPTSRGVNGSATWRSLGQAKHPWVCQKKRRQQCWTTFKRAWFCKSADSCPQGQRALPRCWCSRSRMRISSGYWAAFRRIL